MEERYKPIPGYEDAYEASNLGNIRNIRTLKVLSTYSTGKGYLLAELWQGNRPKRHRVHRLVLLAHVGNPPDGHVACHRDDVKANNRLSNLYWGTRDDNARDAIRNGRVPYASKTECVNGHPYSGDNIRWTVGPGGGFRRTCVACRDTQYDVVCELCGAESKSGHANTRYCSPVCAMKANGVKRASQPNCVNGHPYGSDVKLRNGHRVCVTCERENGRRYLAGLKAAGRKRNRTRYEFTCEGCGVEASSVNKRTRFCTHLCAMKNRG